MKEYTIIITSPPQAQGRPRFSVRGGHAIVFDPHKDIKAYTKLLISQQFDQVLECPLELVIKFFMKIPKSTSKKKHELMISDKIKHVKRPDIDNLLKLYLDCSNGVIYRDDSQVYKISASKEYSKNPRVEMIVRWNDDG